MNWKGFGKKWGWLNGCAILEIGIGWWKPAKTCSQWF